MVRRHVYACYDKAHLTYVMVRRISRRKGTIGLYVGGKCTTKVELAHSVRQKASDLAIGIRYQSKVDPQIAQKT